jgi:hypothetical protein
MLLKTIKSKLKDSHSTDSLTFYSLVRKLLLLLFFAFIAIIATFLLIKYKIIRKIVCIILSVIVWWIKNDSA